MVKRSKHSKKEEERNENRKLNNKPMNFRLLNAKEKFRSWSKDRMVEREGGFDYLWLSCRYRWKGLVPCSWLKKDWERKKWWNGIEGRRSFFFFLKVETNAKMPKNFKCDYRKWPFLVLACSWPSDLIEILIEFIPFPLDF